MSIYFRIEGKPVPKQSTRFAGFRAFTDKKVIAYAEKVRYSFLKDHYFWNYTDVMYNPVEVKITVHVAIPKSFNKKQKEEALKGLIKPTTRPDVDNITKGILDPLNGVVWEDDKQVYKLQIEKKYDEINYVEVEVSEVTDD